MIINDVVFIQSTLFTTILSKYIDNSAEDIQIIISQETIDTYYSVNGIYRLEKEEGSSLFHTTFLSGMGKEKRIFSPWNDGDYYDYLEFCEFTHQDTYPSDMKGYCIQSSKSLYRSDNLYYKFFDLLDVLFFLGVPVDYQFFRDLFLEISKEACDIMTFEKDGAFGAKKTRIGSVNDLISNLRKRHYLEAELLNRSIEDIDITEQQPVSMEENITVPESAYKVIYALIEIIKDKNKIKSNAIQLEIQERYPDMTGLKERNLQKIFGKASNSMK